jgi:hypothetical protein
LTEVAHNHLHLTAKNQHVSLSNKIDKIHQKAVADVIQPFQAREVVAILKPQVSAVNRANQALLAIAIVAVRKTKS